MVIYIRDVMLILVLDEPPQALMNAWIRDRMAYYEIFQPQADIRDVKPPPAPPGGVHKVRLIDDEDQGIYESTEMWQILLKDHDKESIK